jgi:hypothetical protein
MNFAADIWIKRMAAVLNVDSNLADFATISATGRKVQLVLALGTGPNERIVKIFNNIIS